MTVELSVDYDMQTVGDLRDVIDNLRGNLESSIGSGMLTSGNDAAEVDRYDIRVSTR